jgi:hypothetical protein
MNRRDKMEWVPGSREKGRAWLVSGSKKSPSKSYRLKRPSGSTGAEAKQAFLGAKRKAG